jgi:hypothetical protein
VAEAEGGAELEEVLRERCVEARSGGGAEGGAEEVDEGGLTGAVRVVELHAERLRAVQGGGEGVGGGEGGGEGEEGGEEGGECGDGEERGV